MSIDEKLKLPKKTLRNHLWCSVIAVFGWSAIALFAMNELGERRLLECQYLQQESVCKLSSQKLLGETKGISIAKAQRAVVEVHEPKKNMHLKGPISPFSYELCLVTAEGRVWLSANDSSEGEIKKERARQINAFLRAPNSSPLKVDGGWSATLDLSENS